MDEYHYKIFTGKEFNELFENYQFIKLTNERCIHNNFKFKEGLNTDTIKFNPVGDCSAGGLYFTEMKYMSEWINYNNTGLMCYVWDVTIPYDAKVYIEKSKCKSTNIKLSNKRSIWDNKKFCEFAVSQNVLTLKYVKEQTEKICELAVSQNGLALHFVNPEFKEHCQKLLKN